MNILYDSQSDAPRSILTLLSGVLHEARDHSHVGSVYLEGQEPPDTENAGVIGR